MICILFSPRATTDFIPTILTRCTERSRHCTAARPGENSIQNKCLSREQMRKDREEGKEIGGRRPPENSLLPFSHSFSFAGRPFPAAFSRPPARPRPRPFAGLESSLGRSGTRQKAAFILHKATEEEEEGAVQRWHRSDRVTGWKELP